MNLGKSIRVACAMTGKTQIELAEHMCTSEQTISNWAQNKAHPSTMKLVMMAGFFDMDTSEFVKNGESK